MFDAIIEINNLVTFTAFETVVCWAFGIITGLGIGTARGRTMIPDER